MAVLFSQESDTLCDKFQSISLSEKRIYKSYVDVLFPQMHTKKALLIHHFVIRKQLEEEQSLPRDGHFIQSEK